MAIIFENEKPTFLIKFFLLHNAFSFSGPGLVGWQMKTDSKMLKLIHENNIYAP
jgi:hypothetical protein